MLNKHWLVAFAVAAMLAAGISHAPMWLLADALAERQPWFGYTVTHGTVWRGDVVDAQWGDRSLGTLSMAIQPWQLVRGRLRYAVSSDAATASFESIDLSRDGVALHDAAFKLPVNINIDGGGRLSARAEMSATFVNLAGNACRDAAGTFIVSGLQFHGAPSVTIAMPAMTGDVSCVDGGFLFRGAGVGDIGEVSGEVTTSLEGRFTASIALRNSAPGLFLLLPLLGFEQSDGQWQLVSNGRFGTLESL